MTHQHISFFKSGTRILGYIFLAIGEGAKIPFVAGIGFACIVAGELLGVLEEFVTK